MRVLQLIDSLDAGGAERMAVNIANANARAGITSFLCSTVRAGVLQDLIDESVTYKMIGKKRKIDMQAFSRFFSWIRKNEIQIIHAHSTSIQLAVLAKMRFPKLKVIWHDHYGMSEVLNKRSTTKLKAIAPFIDAIIAVNEPLKDWSQQTLGVKKVYFINNFFQFSDTCKESTELKGVAGKRVLCLANLRPQKNHINFIKAFKTSIENHPEWSLHLVGKDFNDMYAESVKNLIVQLGLENNVFCYGSCLDVKSIMEQSDIGVLASISEGLPLALLEYGYTGLPVITTNVGQCSEVVGDNGIVISDVIDKMADALIRLYENKGNERGIMGANFRESVHKKYSETAFVKTIQPIYKELLPLP